MNSQPMVILLAEDDDGHALLVRRNLMRAGVSNEIVHVGDGQEALDFIRREGKFSHRQPGLPILALIDINMPRVDGIEVLAQIKAAPETAKIPVVMLTTTDDPREIQRCYALGCSVYITKPIDYEAFVDSIRRLGMLLQIIRVPAEATMP